MDHKSRATHFRDFFFGQPIGTKLVYHEDVVSCVQLHENWLIICSVDKSTRIWDLGDGKLIHKLEQSGYYPGDSVATSISAQTNHCWRWLLITSLCYSICRKQRKSWSWNLVPIEVHFRTWDSIKVEPSWLPVYIKAKFTKLISDSAEKCRKIL